MEDFVKTIHRGDPGRASIMCGAREVIKEDGFGGRARNWSWHDKDVTCKRCLKILKRRAEGR